jgi:hypothetical protein
MRFAVVGTFEKFTSKKHVEKCWRFCQEYNLKSFLVLLDYSKDEMKSNKKFAKIKSKLPSRIYPSLGEVPEGIDVVVPCLMPRHIPDIIEESLGAGAQTIWFQEKNWTQEYQDQAEEKGLTVVRGCMLKHRKHTGIGKFLHPCFWHGWGCPKAQPKYRR